MKKTTFLATVVSLALVLGCGKRSEENITEKRIEQQTISEENVDISD